jgi:protein-tyrosine phosphatase
MRLKYVVVFSLFAAYLVAIAAYLGGWAWLLVWPALSFFVVAAGYLGLGPGIFGKRDDGRRAWWAVVILLPYLALTWIAWHLQRGASREPCCHEIAPGLWLGRRPLRHELPADVALVVDLTAEFTPARGVCLGRAYLALPTLDGSAPAEVHLRNIVARLTDLSGPVYVHCAAGHGRSALVVASLLLARGLAANPRQAEAMLRAIRPGVRLTPGQRRLLQRLANTSSDCPAGNDDGTRRDQRDSEQGLPERR